MGGELVITSDAEGNAVPASYYGMQGDWPPDTMSDCEAGWNGSFDKLAESLR